MDYKAPFQYYGGVLYEQIRSVIDSLGRHPMLLMSPIEIAVRGMDTTVSPVEVIARQSGDYPEVPQSTYPTPAWNDLGRVTPYHTSCGSDNSRASRIYTGESSRGLHKRDRKKRKGPVSIRQNRIGRRARLPIIRHSTAARTL